MKPGRFFAFASLLLVFSVSVAFAELTEGRNFILIAAQPTEASTLQSIKDKVEVTEFFWYGCSHCHDLDPVLNQWRKTLPEDVVFRRIPAIFLDGRWAPGARLFYALDAIAEEQRLHSELFDAIHVGHMNYRDEKEVTEWLAQKGVERGKFSAAYNSAAVQSKVNRAQDLTQAHAIRGVPTVIVAGKYLTSNTMAGSNEALPGIIDQLVALARAERGKSK
ncbi:MAG: thiol:disulfide interchange protein DsbA/DsbL [Sterolibacterium sp.]|nr:thiol:disulfide interchange protein DsbA/DsbL [Sterolibacterium sp.]